MNTTAVYDDPYPFEDFAPTLSQCFVVVAVGYLMARLELLKSSDLQSLNAFAAYFAMPGIICMSLMDADFGDFRWELLAGIFVGKFVLFVAVGGFLLWLEGNAGVAGTVALFCVHSNDLPVGNPLMSSLYKDCRPQMMKYLFLIPALTAVFFVPATNIMISAHRKQRRSEEGTRWWREREHLQQLGALLKNPVVLATLSGIGLNFAFGGNPSPILHQPIKVAAATIPGLALAILGFSFVRKERYLMSSAVVPAMVLLILKLVFTPILLHSILRIVTEESSSAKLLSDFALLYGIVSPAVAVFQSGREFRKSLAAMSVALIAATLFCFPVSYVVARLTIAPVHPLSSYVEDLKRILFWTACVAMAADVVVWTTMIWQKRWNLFPGRYVMYLVLTQFLTCCGVLAWSWAWSPYCQMALYFGGEVSGYLWTGTLAVVLVFKKRSPVEEKAFSLLFLTAISASVLITGVMCCLLGYDDGQNVLVVGRAGSNFEFLQLVISTTLLSVSLLVVTGCVVYHFKRRKIKAAPDVHGYDNSIFTLHEQDDDFDFCRKIGIPERSGEKWAETEEARFYYREVVRDEEFETGQSCGEREWTNGLRHLLLLRGSVMFVRVVARSFQLAGSEATEVTIPLEFLQSILFIGEGVFLLFLFGVDVRTLAIVVRKWCRKLRRGSDEIPPDLSKAEEVSRLRDQFYKFYFVRCFRDLATERRWRECVYRDSFWGHQLVDWMIAEGICENDAEAEEMGQKLLEGGVFRHVNDTHHFYDAPYLYYFVRTPA